MRLLKGTFPRAALCGCSSSAKRGDAAVAIVIPIRNEARGWQALICALSTLDPYPAEIVVVDGDSTDGSAELAEAAGMRVIRHRGRGRGAAINAGVAECTAPIVCVLHADTTLPADAVAVIRGVLVDPHVALAGFTPVIRGQRLRWATTAHNWLKTWYAPLLFRPDLFLRGGRLLFGDHAMFFRRSDFLAVGGCDAALAIMEDADLCIRLSRLGRVRLIGRRVETSDRRIAAWGPLRANWIYLSIAVRWGLGFRRELGRSYPDIR
jgi:glycosyltransferase involved in cell wall biosynthesis